MITSSGRFGWKEIPEPLRRQVEDLLGSPVIRAVSQTGGFSPGSADRVTTATGVRAFVKAAGVSLNPETPAIHLREAAIAAALPHNAHAPKFIGTVQWEDWVAIVLADVEGRQPALPWTREAIRAVLTALEDLAAVRVPDGLAQLLRPLEIEAVDLFGGWTRLRDQTRSGIPVDPTLPQWILRHIDRLEQLADEALDDLPGDRLVHLDVRADNVLIRPDGTVALVDWPWACRGAGWFDALALLINVRLGDATADVEALIRDHAVFAPMSTDAATRSLVGLAGFFLEAGLRPAPAGLPTLRAFQLAQAEASVRWIRERTGGDP